MGQQTNSVLEQWASMIAGHLKARQDIITQALLPPGGRPPFTQQLSKIDALSFWRQHINDGLGQQVLSNMQPADIMELHQALGQASSPTGGTGEWPTQP